MPAGFEGHLQARPGVPAGGHAADPRQLRHRLPRAGHVLRLRRRQRLLHVARSTTSAAKKTASRSRTATWPPSICRAPQRQSGPEVDHRGKLRLRLRLVAERELPIRADYYDIKIDDEVRDLARPSCGTKTSAARAVSTSVRRPASTPCRASSARGPGTLSNPTSCSGVDRAGQHLQRERLRHHRRPDLPVRRGTRRDVPGQPGLEQDARPRLHQFPVTIRSTS